MKLSIAWIFDHLEADWKNVDIAQLVATFNTTTAEVEHFYKKNLDLSLFSLGQVTKLSADKTIVFSSEWNKEFSFESRPAREGDVFLIKKDGWATLRDLHGEKDGLVPAVFVLGKDLAGSWKNNFETEDYILELDNKSITNRPDMWCHRGFAREVAAILGVRLKPLDHFLEKHAVKNYESVAVATPAEPFSITVKNPDKVKHFAGLYLQHAECEASLLWMAYRLIKIDSRPINALVDMTNYVMQDLGQPMHAFDAGTIATKKIEPRLALKGETITLLDGQKVELAPTDLVITDGKKPIALAGIMGGKESGVSDETEALFVEAACFNAATIRATSSRLKLRTEASARFEKSLDPNLNVIALQRFLKLVHAVPLSVKIADAIASVGHEMQSPVVEISHSFIQSRLGLEIPSEKIKKILEKLEFAVQEHKAGSDVRYAVTVPTFRATKDVGLKEDIVEEIGRFVGYATIPLVLPAMSMRPTDLTATRALRTIKHHLAYSLAMHEVNNYAFFDEEFLPRLQWQPAQPVTMKNPVSEHWKSLVSSLVPHLFNNLYQNETKEDRLRFFECGRVWSFDAQKINEQKSVAGVFFDRKKQIDFYGAKAELSSLFNALSLDIQWEKSQKSPAPWYDLTQTAALVHEGNVVGVAGKVEASMLARVVSGDAFVFEMNGEFLTSYRPQLKRFVPVSKYPVVWLDISMLVPLAVTVAQLSACIAGVDARISHVELVDFFEKEEWKDQRSLTFRYHLQDKERTLEKEVIDAVSRKVVQAVQSLGVTVR